MKCWNSAFNAQGSRLIIVVVQLGVAVKNICSSSGGAQEKGKTGWNSVSDQITMHFVLCVCVCDLVFFFSVRRSCWKSMSLCCDEGEDGLILLWRATPSCMFLIALIVVVPFLVRVVFFFFFFFGAEIALFAIFLWILCAVWCLLCTLSCFKWTRVASLNCSLERSVRLLCV
jgi:hypothetical protein